MAICPKGAIKIEGRFTSPDDLFPLPGKAEMASYDAPLALYFYGSPYTDPADPLIAATYAMTAAESLGLGTCMLGGIHPFIQSGRAARKFREKHGIRFKSREGLFLIIGHPRVKYQHGITRTFANIDYMKGASKN